MTAAIKLPELDRAAAADLASRTACAVEYGCRDMANGLADFIDSLPMPKDDRAKADKIADATEVYLRALSYSAAYSYGLCLLSLPTVAEAGKRFRDADVQEELRMSAMRVAMGVMSK